MAFFSLSGKKQKGRKKTHPMRETGARPSRRLMLALEPRYLYDAAALATGLDVLSDSTTESRSQTEAPDTPDLWSKDTLSIFPPPNTFSTEKTAVGEIVFVDSSVENYEQLVSGISPSAKVIILDAGQDGVAQITDTLAAFSDVKAVHILSHGGEGQINIGTSTLSSATLDNYGQMLAGWDASLSDDADILLYGCNVAAGDVGIDFVSSLADLTQADVAASNDLTGNSHEGGDWDLETAIGDVESGLIFDERVTDAYEHTLAAPTMSPDGPQPLTGITEDQTNNAGNLVSDLVTASGIATDTATPGIAIYAADDQNGTWEFSTDGGATWTNVGNVSDTSALLLRGDGGGNDDLIRFTPDGNNAPSATPTFSYYAWDQSTGIEGIKVNVTTRGGTTAFSSLGDSADISVTDVNDAPVLDSSGTMSLTSINEDELNPAGNTIASIISSAGGDRITDVDSGALEGVAITGLSGAGTWEYSINGGSNWFAIGAVLDNGARVLYSDAMIRYIPDADYSGTLTSAITFRAWDRTGGYANGQAGVNASVNDGTTPFSALDETASLTVNPSNDDPVLAVNTGHALLEDNSATITNAMLSVTDVDNTATDIVFTLGAVPTKGLLKKSGVTLSVNDTFTQDDIDNSRITYTPNADENGADSFDFTVSDGAGGAISSTSFSLSITPDNDAPTLDLDVDNSSGDSGNNYQVNYSEAQAAISIADTDVDVADVDSTAFANVTLVFSGLQDGNNELMLLDSSSYGLATDVANTTIGGNYDVTVVTGVGTATVTITKQGAGNFSETEVEALVKAIQYQNSDADNPTDGNRTVAITVNDTALDSAVATTTITVNAINDLPTISNLGGTIVFTESDAPLLIDTGSDAVVADVDDTTFASVKLSYSNLQDGDNERLDLEGVSISLGTTGVTNTATYNVSVTASGSSATVIITKAVNFADASQVEALIHLLKYDHIDNDNPTDGNRTVAVAVNDGTSDSLASTVTIDVNPVNDALVFGVNDPLGINEDSTGTITTALLQYTDVDNTPAELVYTVGATLPTKGVLQKNGVTLSTGQTFTQADIDNNIITYVPTTDANGADSFDFSVSDGTVNLPGPFTFNINITPQPDAPTLDLDANNSSGATGNDYQFDFVEGNAPTAIVDADVSVLDVDSTTFSNIKLNLSGLLDGNNEKLILDGSTFDLATSYILQNTFNNAYQIVISANAGLNTASITITENGGDGVFSIVEAETLLKVIQYQHIGGDNPTDGNRTVGITINDGALDSAVATTTINVNPVNDNPTLPITNAGLALNEETTSTITSGLLSVSDVDNTASELTYTIDTAPTKGVLKKSGATLSAGSTFTQADINNGFITYTANTDQDGADSFAFTITDSSGGSIPQDTFSISITGINDAPVLNTTGGFSIGSMAEEGTGFAKTVAEIITAGGVGFITDVDSGAVQGLAITGVDNSNGTWRYHDGSWHDFTGLESESSAVLLSTTAFISFVPATDFVGTSTITFRAWDQTSGNNGDTGVSTLINGGSTAFSSNQDTAQITVTAVNDAPQIPVSTGTTLTNISEDAVDNAGQLVSSFIGATITDPDGPSELEGIAIYSLNDNGHGTWEYNVGGGWLSVGTVNNTNALLLRSTDSIRFNPSSGTAGTADFTYYAWDQATGSAGFKVDVSTRGNDSAYSIANDTATVTITSVNDAPVLTPATPSMNPIDENATTNGGELISSIVGTSITDPDGASELEGVAIYFLSSGNGSWEYSTNGGSSWNAVGTVSLSNALLLGSDDKIRFVPDGDNATSATFSYYAWDQSSGTNGLKTDVSVRGGTDGTSAFSETGDTASITVTAVNDAPVLSAGTMTLSSVNEDTNPPGDTVASIISSGGGDLITDVDLAAVEGIAVTSVDDTNGTWQYKIGAGAWTAFGAVTESTARLLASDALIRFVPASDYSGTVTNGITFRAWDQSDGKSSGDTGNVTVNGSSTAFSSGGQGAASITVNPVNDAPVLTATPMNLTAINEDAVNNNGNTIAQILATGGNPVTDTDSGDLEGVAIYAINNSNGKWQYSINGGSSWIDVGTVSTINALLLRDTDYLRFVPDEQDADSADWDFYAWDQSSSDSAGDKVDVSNRGNATAFSNGSGTATIAVSALNDRPVLTSTGGFSIGSMLEDDTGFAKQISEIITAGGAGLITDVDGPAQGVAITGVDNANGNWWYKPFGGSKTYFTGGETESLAVLLDANAYIGFEPDADYFGSASLSFRAWDTTGGGVSGNSGVDTVSSLPSSGYSSDTDSFYVTITNTNDAPVLASASPVLTMITEDNIGNSGTTISSLVGSTISDIDPSPLEGIAIYNLNSGNGTWQYNAGGSWLDVGLVDTGNALLLRSTDSIRFVPDEANATTADFTYYAWDQTSGTVGTKVDVTSVGGTTTFSANNNTASITVSAVNDAPVLDPANTSNFTGITEDESNNGGGLVSSFVNTAITDVDSGAVEGIAIYGTTGTEGHWEYDSGSGWTSIGTVSGNQALLLRSTDKVRFVPDGTFAPSPDPTILYYGWDQSSGTVGTKVDVSSRGLTTAFSSVGAVSSITLTDVNDAPVLSDQDYIFSTINEDQVYTDTAADGNSVTELINSVNGGNNITDGDLAVPGNAPKAIAVTKVDNTNGFWEYWDGGAWQKFDTNSGIQDISATARLLDASGQIRFSPTGEWSGAAILEFRAWDQSSGAHLGTLDASTGGSVTPYSSLADTATITVSSVNDAPVIANLDGDNPTFSELAGTPILLDVGGNLTITDPADSPADFNGGNLTVAFGANTTVDDILAIRDIGPGDIQVSGSDVSYAGNVIGTWSGGNGVGNDLVITFNSSGFATPTAITALARAIEFDNNTANPGSVQRTISFTVDDNDGGSSTSAAADVFITMTTINDSPVIANLDTDVVGFTENGGPISLDSGTALTISDVDTPQFNGGNLTVAFQANTTANDRLTIEATGNGAGEINVSGAFVLYEGNTIGTWSGGDDGSTPLVITFTSANATPAATTALAKAIRFENISEAPDTNARTIRFTVNDGDGATSSASDVTVNMFAVNDAPTLNLDGDDSSGAGGNNYSFTFTEGDVATNIADTDTVLADVDNTTFASVSLNWSVLTDGDSERMVLDGSTFNLGTTVGATDTTGGNYTVTVTADTGADTAAVTITKQGGGTFSQVEVETLVEAIQYQHADGDNPTDGNRTVEVIVNDGTDDSAAATTTINVDPVNDAPTLNLDGDDSSGAGGNNYSFTFTENDSATAIVDTDVDLADVDNTTFTSVGLDWSVLTDGDSERMILDGSTFNLGTTVGATNTTGGNYAVTVTADTGADTAAVTITKQGGGSFTEVETETLLKAIQYYHSDGDNPTDGNRTVDISVSDGALSSGVATTTINVDPVNDAPTLNLDGDDSS
ncbi:MAG: DUF4347 domain-containing protein, partial [Desulfobulbaceae bacterium]|nr:DUF4347 domain-containing protein [Desulfobulbaceae bacterium]